MYLNVLYEMMKRLYIGDCNYWYDQGLMSPDHSVCSITRSNPVHLSCGINHPCDNIQLDVRWYRSSTEMYAEEDVIKGNGQYINSTSINGKYTVILQIQNGTVNNSVFDHCCYTTYFLVINNFNHSDNGHYWCQFVANKRLLLPSPYGYIALSEGAAVNNRDCSAGDFIRSLDQAKCAENTTMTNSGRMTCNTNNTDTTEVNSGPTQFGLVTVTESISGFVPINNISIPLSTTTKPHDTTLKDNNSLFYGAIAGAFVCFTTVLLLVIMCLGLLFYKYRKLEKKSK